MPLAAIMVWGQTDRPLCPTGLPLPGWDSNTTEGKSCLGGSSPTLEDTGGIMGSRVRTLLAAGPSAHLCTAGCAKLVGAEDTGTAPEGLQGRV